MTNFYDLVMPSITSEPVTFSRYRDITCLIVNVASQ
jgi:glutathione peroxidase-family protein